MDGRLDDRTELDPLTQVYTKDTFLQQAREQIRRHPEIEYDMVTSDIEHFRVVNDLFGFDAGDRLLRFMADCIRQCCAQHDGICGRYYADVFVWLLPRREGLIEQIMDWIGKRLSTYPLEMQLIVMFGVYHIEDRTLSLSAMCDRSTLALRSIKGGYQNTFAVYREEHRQAIIQEQFLIGSLQKAIERDEFLVYFQPKFSLTSGEINGAEALVRWNSAEHGLIMPGEFIPAFEKNGSIFTLDSHVWELTCRQLRQWMDEKKAVVPVSVNVSRVDIYHPGLKEHLLQLLEKYHLPSEYLVLEITETAYSALPEQMIELVKDLQQAGFHIEMDDFGSGYSSLNSLRRLPVDEIKIDLRFLQDYDKTARGASILKSIVRLARGLEIPVITEGIETEEQALFLRRIGCERGQGYYCSRPVPADAFSELLDKNRTEMANCDILSAKSKQATMEGYRGTRMEEKAGRETEKHFMPRFIIVMVLLGITAGLFLFYEFWPQERVGFRDASAQEYNTGWYYTSPDGTRNDVTVPATVPADAQERATLYRMLPEQMDNDLFLCFESHLQSVEVRIDDDVIYSYGLNDWNFPLHAQRATVWNKICIPQEAAGQTLSVTLGGGFRYIGVFREFTIGSEGAIFYSILDDNIFGWALALLAILLGLFCIATYILSWSFYGEGRENLLFGLMALFFGFWMAGESRMGQFLLETKNAFSFLTYVSVRLCPYFFLRYLLTQNIWSERRWLNLNANLFLVNLGLSLVLQVTGLANLHQSLPLTHALMALMVVVVTYSLLREKLHFHNSEVRTLYLPLAVLLASGVVELLTYYTLNREGGNVGYFMKIGLVLFILIVTQKAMRRLMQIMKLSRNTRYYTELATNDYMTGCHNRIAYNEDIKSVKPTDDVCVVVSDLNDLRRINNSYGRSEGDEAIILLSRYLLDVFAENGTCYRTGGDEFITLLHDVEESQVQVMISAFHEKIAGAARQTRYPFAVAVGYAYTDGLSSIEEIVRQADQDMYINKHQEKEEKSEKSS